jgi:hypothetical protein
MLLSAPPVGNKRRIAGGVRVFHDERSWGQLSIVVHVSGGGHGPSLNFCASVASGRIFTLPRHWDDRIALALDHGNHANDDELFASNVKHANLCANSSKQPSGSPSSNLSERPSGNPSSNLSKQSSGNPSTNPSKRPSGNPRSNLSERPRSIGAA